jgi:manganese transport protein
MVRDLLLGQTVDKVRHSLGVPMLVARPDRAIAAAAHQDEAPAPESGHEP